MAEAVLVSAVRTPVGRAPKGTLSTTRPDDLAAIAIAAALERVPSLEKREVEDVILGCAQPEGEAGYNMARFAAIRAGLPVEVPGVTVNRLCSSGLEAIALADMRIRAGGEKVVAAMRATIEALSAAGLRDKVKVLIGGAPVTMQYANEIGADGYSDNASGAVSLVKSVLAVA